MLIEEHTFLKGKACSLNIRMKMASVTEEDPFVIHRNVVACTKALRYIERQIEEVKNA